MAFHAPGANVLIHQDYVPVLELFLTYPGKSLDHQETARMSPAQSRCSVSTCSVSELLLSPCEVLAASFNHI